MEEIQMSPVPKKHNAITYSFPDVLKEIIKGRKATKLEWNTNDIYIMLKDGYLMIYRGDTDKLFHPLKVSDGDLLGEDWCLMPEAN